MEYNEYQTQASEYMRLAIPLMNKYGVAMTPANYAVWYEYVAGTNAALQGAVDNHLAENTQLNDQQSRELYERFFDREREQSALLEMRQSLKQVLSEVLSFVSASAVTSQSVSTNLVDIIDKISPEMSSDDIQEVVNEVVAETRLAASNSELLVERLNSTVFEIRDLKKDLNDAKREARTDTLTKLANRKAFDSVLEKATIDSDINNIDVCIIFADLDLFKRVNDVHGHLVGDQVLKVIARSLKGAVKGRDLVARYGGEEFAIILLNTTLVNAKNIAENIRAEIAVKRIQRKDNHESIGKITMSFGVARYFRSEGAESFLQRADRALYMSKRNGRNAVTEALPPII